MSVVDYDEILLPFLARLIKNLKETPAPEDLEDMKKYKDVKEIKIFFEKSATGASDREVYQAILDHIHGVRREKEEAEKARLAAIEAERKAKEDAERAEREAKEAAARAEREAKEAAERAAREAKEAEERAKREAEERELAERKAKEDAEIAAKAKAEKEAAEREAKTKRTQLTEKCSVALIDTETGMLVEVANTDDNGEYTLKFDFGNSENVVMNCCPGITVINQEELKCEVVLQAGEKKEVANMDVKDMALGSMDVRYKTNIQVKRPGQA